MAAQAVPPLRFTLLREHQANVVSTHAFKVKCRTLPVGHTIELVPDDFAVTWRELGYLTFSLQFDGKIVVFSFDFCIILPIQIKADHFIQTQSSGCAFWSLEGFPWSLGGPLGLLGSRSFSLELILVFGLVACGRGQGSKQRQPHAGRFLV